MTFKQPQPRKAQRAFRVQYTNVHLFLAPPKLVESDNQGLGHTAIVMLAGIYHATWEDGPRRGKVVARAGDVVMWPPSAVRVEHNEPNDRQRALMIYFDWKNPTENLPVMLHDRQRLVTALAHALLRVKDTRLADRQALRNAFLASIVGEYMRLADAEGEGLVAKVAAYTQAHLRQRFGLQQLSRHVGLEKHYFGRRYKALTGRTPMQDVRRIRVEHAIGILQGSPRIPLKDVAFRVGMGSCQLLARWLRRELHLTSRQIRGI